MFTSKKTEEDSKGKATGQWRAGWEFLDDKIFYWKSQLSKTETFLPRMQQH